MAARAEARGSGKWPNQCASRHSHPVTDMAIAVVEQVRVYPLSIPLRGKVEHAATARGVSDSVVVAVELQGGVIGYGETLPRRYVTGESVDTVVGAIESFFGPILLGFHAENFADALGLIDALPWDDSTGRPVPAARAAVELALLDAICRTFDRGAEDVARWMGLPGLGAPGSVPGIRFSGVLASESLSATRRRLRLMYWAGLRHFKLKVAFANDLEKLRMVCGFLGNKIVSGRATIRVDANGAWTPDDAGHWLRRFEAFPLAGVEQPLSPADNEQLPALREEYNPCLIHDESLVTFADAKSLIGLGVADVFNIRLSKCGGFLPSLKLAALARREGVGIQLGCMVGETSILSAAAIRFLQVCPGVRWAEGCFGTFLLETDVTRRSLRFGYAGRPPKLDRSGFGVAVDVGRVEHLCADGPKTFRL